MTTLYGVSPAYFLSLFGEAFTAYEVAKGLDLLSRLGYDGFQLEVFRPETLETWTGEGGRVVRSAAERLGLRSEVFVGHFLLDAFADPKSLASDFGPKELGRCLVALEPFPERSVVSLPLPPFATGAPVGLESYRPLEALFREKVLRMVDMIRESGRRPAFELMPGCFLGGVEGFLRFAEDTGRELALILDTGHAWASKEPMGLLPARLVGRIAGTHLCDNVGADSRSDPPGSGTIDWDVLLGGLRSTGYTGSLDVEIRCPAPDVEETYRAALDFVRARWGSMPMDNVTKQNV